MHAILDALADLGYGADVHILGAPYYGVPQMRWRTIILGLRGAVIPQSAWPEPTRHAPVRANFTTTLMGDKLLSSLAPKQMRHSLRFVKPLEICLHYRTVNAAKRSKNTR